MAFTHTIGRYASFGTVSSLPGEIIDLFWFIIDNDLKGAFELDNMIYFKLIDTDGKLSVRFRQDSLPDTDLVIDTDYAFDADLPRHFRAIDHLGRETIVAAGEEQ